MPQSIPPEKKHEFHDTGRILENELVKTNALLEAIIDASQNGILVVDQTGKVIKVNGKFGEIWKIPSNILNTSDDKTLLKFIFDQLADPDGFYEKVMELYENPLAQSKDLIFLRDGRIFERNSKPMYLDGLPNARVWSFLDITERYRAENNLATKERMLNAIIENMPDQIYIKDRESRFILCNSPVAANCGAETTEEIIGKTDFDFFPHHLAEQYFKDEQLIMNSGIPLINHEEITGNKTSPDVRWNLTTKVPVMNSNGQVAGIIGINRDITERKNSEREIEQKNAELIKLNDEKDKFFSIIAHDLRSPFQSFLGFTEIMVEDLPTLGLDEIKKIAVSLRTSAGNLFNLLENLLEWSQMQRNLISFNPQKLNLAEKIAASLSLVRVSADKKSIGISANIPSDIMIKADSRMFESLLRNLLFNAVKFTARGGKISIQAGAGPEGATQISVKDTGIGMNTAILDNIFSIHKSTSRLGTEGELSTGLGLLLCKDYVEKHNGKIWAESEEGKGSAFYFTLPAKS